MPCLSNTRVICCPAHRDVPRAQLEGRPRRIINPEDVVAATLDRPWHYGDVVMGTMASQIASLTIVYSTVYSGADQRKHQSSASLAFVPGIHRGPVNFPLKWPVTRKMFPFDDVIMIYPDYNMTKQHCIKRILGKICFKIERRRLHCDVTHLFLTTGVVALHIPSWGLHSYGITNHLKHVLSIVTPATAWRLE